MATLQNVLQSIAAYINQDPTLSTGTDLTMQVNLVNQAIQEWGVTYQWKQLKQSIAPSFTVSAVSVALPQNFSKTRSPLFDVAQSPAVRYFEIDPSERYQHVSTDKYMYILGNDVTGYNMMVNPPLASGASLNIDIQVNPSSVATLQDIIPCPSSQFIVTRTLAKILSARSDPRFPSMDQQSDNLLQNLIEEEMAASGGELNRTSDQYSRMSFRVGRDG